MRGFQVDMLSKKMLFSQEKNVFMLKSSVVLLLSKSATDVKVTADMVKEALEEAEKAQIAAEAAIKQADEDIQGTQNLLTSVRYLELNCMGKTLT